MDSLTFPVAHCASCSRDVLVARDLDEDDEWIQVCTLCSTVLSPSNPRQYSAESLKMLGYDVDGASLGCGAGGSCGSCSSST